MLNVLPLLLPVAGLPPPAGPSGAAAAGLSDAIYGRQGQTKQFRYRQAVPHNCLPSPTFYPCVYGRRIYTEDKAKVVADARRTELLRFLALVILQQDNFEE